MTCQLPINSHSGFSSEVEINSSTSGPVKPGPTSEFHSYCWPKSCYLTGAGLEFWTTSPVMISWRRSDTCTHLARGGASIVHETACHFQHHYFCLLSLVRRSKFCWVLSENNLSTPHQQSFWIFQLQPEAKIPDENTMNSDPEIRTLHLDR